MMNNDNSKVIRSTAGAWLLGVACLLGQASALAQSSVMIWPLDPVIEDDQRASALWLENRGAQAVSLQVRVLGWSQNGREESYDAQDVVVASPPVAVIPPGARQLVRLMNTRPTPDGKELAFRVLVDELPGNDAAADSASGNAQGSSMGIKLQIRYSVPLFVTGKGVWTKARADRKRDPATAAQPVLSWRIDREQDGVFLSVRNTGAAHARLTAAQWARGNDTTTINAGLLGYVLAGAEMRWRLESPPPMGFSPQARVNGGEAPVLFAPQ
jgi:fimbrial chaperone protein